jgi:hypothetical protein
MMTDKGSLPTSAFERTFAPSEVDLDALAEAIRGLLREPPATTRNRITKKSGSDLLPSRRRVSHVLGANDRQ